jgi:hypothetical protein
MSDFDRDCGRCSLIRISEPEVGAYYLVVIAPNRAFVHLSKGQIISKGQKISAPVDLGKKFQFSGLFFGRINCLFRSIFRQFWRRSYQNIKMLHNLCLHFARQDGQDNQDGNLTKRKSHN